MAVNWSKLELIDAPGFSSGSDGDRATARYYLRSTNLANRPKRGDSAPSYVGTGWKVNSASCDPIGPYNYIVTVQFSRYLSTSGVGVGKSYTAFKTKWDIEYGRGEFLFDEHVYGVRLATDETAKAYCLGGADAAFSGYLPIDRDTSNGNTPILAATWASAVPNDCPFTVRPASTYFLKSMVCVIVTITFYRDASHGTVEASLAKFNGVNGASGTGTFPEDFEVPLYTTAGKWRAIDQRVTRVLDEREDPFWQITRTAMMPPTDCVDKNGTALVWSSSKCGGTMVWPTWP